MEPQPLENNSNGSNAAHKHILHSHTIHCIYSIYYIHNTFLEHHLIFRPKNKNILIEITHRNKHITVEINAFKYVGGYEK